jgi:hypothetical protein
MFVILKKIPMRYTTYILFALLCFSCINQNEQSNNVTRGNLINKEKSLWQAWKTHDRNTWEILTADDYLYVGDDGVMTRVEVLKEFGGLAVLEDYNIIDSIRCSRISPDVWILTYTAKLKGTINNKPVERIDMEASVWARRNGEWKNTFLHEVTKQ